MLDFYGDVVQNLTPWVAKAPRLAATDEAAIPDAGDDAAIAGVVDPEELEGVASTSSGMVAGGSYKSALTPSEGPPPEPEPPQDQ